jgi:biopolymer transport protein ExbD
MPVRLSTNSQDEHEDGRIEIVPLIDIMFFLLAAFMLVSLSMTQINRVPVVLPDSSASLVEKSVPPIHFAVDQNGVITLDQNILTVSEVTSLLTVKEKKAELRVLIAAHADCRHQQVLRVLDAIRGAGIENVSFETKASN